ncbi:hypothetical protein [Flavobacterium sp. 25HG05S-40]|uniref:hypothetical protein n=1 Tax=Flavobacterium sp. 25HG05S-40 TaxID=3458682 RepID=UPI004044126A
MKKVFLGFLLIFSVFVFSSFLFTNKGHDKQLVGIWKGFEKDRETDGVEKHWILQRYENGKYVIMFTTKQGCDIETLFEKGEWWTKDGKFYEKNEVNNIADVYNYEVKEKIVVDYKSIELNGESNSTYFFTDYKIDLD